MNIGEVKGFFGDFRWLSNFWLAEVVYDGASYPCTEAAYQAAKTTDLNLRQQFQVGSGVTGRKAKVLGYKLLLRSDWEDVKLQVMYDVCWDKFTRHEDLRELLLMTGDAHLEEMNTWGDTFWGVCDGVGENHLGRILMRIREGLRDIDYVRDNLTDAIEIPEEYKNTSSSTGSRGRFVLHRREP